MLINMQPTREFKVDVFRWDRWGTPREYVVDKALAKSIENMTGHKTLGPCDRKNLEALFKFAGVEIQFVNVPMPERTERVRP